MVLGIGGGGTSMSGVVVKVSGETVTTSVPTNVIINNSGNPLLLNDSSGGVSLWSGVVRSVVVIAPTTNSGDVYIGGSVAGQMPYSGQGLPLSPGASVTIEINQLGHIKCVGTVSGFSRLAYLAKA
jgi:hypothetical protein